MHILYVLKGEITLFNIFFLLIVIIVLLYRYQKRKIANLLFYLSLVLFLISSTYYFPHYIANHFEKIYPPLSTDSIKHIRGKVYIHVLGSGYAVNKSIPPNSQIGLAALGRLAEAIRVFRNLDSATIVCSGKSMQHDLETQAQVTKKAAMVLGIPAEQLETLDTPSTTMEEAVDLSKKYGTNIQLIIATDALHMPRAIRFFKKVGFKNPIAAPTNFKAMENDDDTVKWLPAIANIGLLNLVFHEYLGNIKAAFHD